MGSIEGEARIFSNEDVKSLSGLTNRIFNLFSFISLRTAAVSKFDELEVRAAAVRPGGKFFN
jgi:hypothetical protein